MSQPFPLRLTAAGDDSLPIMFGLFFGILLIVVGASFGLRQSRKGGAMSLEWRTNELPKHEHEQAKRS
jgi:hypothetical protein